MRLLALSDLPVSLIYLGFIRLFLRIFFYDPSESNLLQEGEISIWPWREKSGSQPQGLYLLASDDFVARLPLRFGLEGAQHTSVLASQ